MYELIKLAELRFPKKIRISNEAQDIITKVFYEKLQFLDRNPSTRLGAKTGVNEFKNHPFFAKLDFDLVLQKKLPAPFKPELSGKMDIRNFDEEFTLENVEQQSFIPEKGINLIKKNNDKFKVFTNN